MEVFNKIATKIIEQQEAIIGPVAVEQAQLVKGLKVTWGKEHAVSVSGNASTVIDHLVEQYKELFGQISVEVCKEAASAYISDIPQNQVPKTLK